MDTLNSQFSHFRHGCDAAATGKLEKAKALRELIGDAVDAMAMRARIMGLKPDNCDVAHNVEAVIYDWLTREADPLTGVGAQCAMAEGVGAYGDPRGVFTLAQAQEW